MNKKLFKAIMLSMCILIANFVKADLTPLDLTIDNSYGQLNGAWFYEAGIAPTGTGNIDSFLVLNGNQDDKHSPTYDPNVEEGYNTDGTLEFDTMNNHTRSLLLSEVGFVTLEGKGDFMEFILDINQKNDEGGSLLSLDKIEIYLSANGDNTGYPSLGTKVWELDVFGQPDNWIKMDADLNEGSGKGDMYAYIPASAFSGYAPGTTFVYLYSMFGAQGLPGESWGWNDGFEEWAVREGQVIPLPGAVLLCIIGMTIAGMKLRKVT